MLEQFIKCSRCKTKGIAFSVYHYYSYVYNVCVVHFDVVIMSVYCLLMVPSLKILLYWHSGCKNDFTYRSTLSLNIIHLLMFPSIRTEKIKMLYDDHHLYSYAFSSLSICTSIGSFLFL